MAFWGVEVKPGKPYTHPSSKTSGRLRVSQATLGIGLTAKRCIVQCNVGDRSPVLLCSLVPDMSEYCHLELEFEEEDEVVFSVIGPRSVHLSGYYLCTSRRHPAFGDSSESYGQDIGHSDTEKSKESSEEDYLEDSFINDGDVEYYHPSPIVSGEETNEELMVDKVDQEEKVGRRRRRLRKRFHLSESEDDGVINEQDIANGDLAAQPHKDDEDNIRISQLIICDKNGDQQKNMEDEVLKTDNQTDHKDQNVGISVGANDAADSSSKSELGLPHASVVASEVEKVKCSETKVEPNAVKKEKKKKNKGHILSHVSVVENSICEAKLQVDESKFNRTDTGTTQHSVPKNVIVLGLPASLAASDVEQQNKKEPKMKKKGKKRENKGSTVTHDSVDEKNSCKAELQMNGSKLDDSEKDIHTPKEQCYVPPNDKKLDGSVLPDSEERKPKSKKRKVKEVEDTITMEKLARDGSTTMEIDKPNPSEETNFSNGIVVEELERGNPDGEVASSGKKVKIHYTGKLKEGGSVYETSIGHKPFRFRLGKCDNVIDGLHLGLEGMQVGSKRRITVPPELGYGSEGYLDSVPPNAWLVFDIELLRVS